MDQSRERLQNKESESLNLVGTLGDFRLLREIGRGGMGVVYEAEQMSLNRRVALKVLPFAALLDDRLLQRFTTESQAAASLHHEHIVPVYGVGRERGIHFYAMQLIQGQSLAEALGTIPHGDLNRSESDRSGSKKSNTQKLARADGNDVDTQPIVAADITTQRTKSPQTFFRRIARVGVEAANAIHYAHSHGILHRDIKPGNLMLDHSGKLWVTDFGLAQVQGRDGLTMTGELIGTLRYMSPEQLSSKTGLLDERTDVYSLGATLYELVVGRPLFDCQDRASLVQQISTGESGRQRFASTAVPQDLKTILNKALERAPADRYQTAGELAVDVRSRQPHPVYCCKAGSGHHDIAVPSLLLALRC